MGCGVSCATLHSESNRHTTYSKQTITKLLPKIIVCKPFLPDKIYRRFQEAVKLTESPYTLKINQKLSMQEQISGMILEKWKIMLYGLDKDNQTYNECLGFEIREQYVHISNGQINPNNSQILSNFSYHQLKKDTQYHQCFGQIEKDIDRTFSFRQQKRKVFQKVLKRISNHFPSMGYTQGVNFVVGYLLLIGYSQIDTFWMFCHLAINQRYLILGLYEDGFPLSTLFSIIFKNMLKRIDKTLHKHLYEKLMIDDSIWIFKWFTTYFIYSFPLNLIQYIWDLVIQLGSVGLIYFSIALVVHIRKKILQLQDVCELTQFFQQLKNIQIFNSNVKLNIIIQQTYQYKIDSSDFQGSDTLEQNFYKTYLKSKYSEEAKTQSQDKQMAGSNKHLNQWYLKLTKDRKMFEGKRNSKKSNKLILPPILLKQYDQMQKSIDILQQKIIKNDSMRLSKHSLKFKSKSVIQQQIQNTGTFLTGLLEMKKNSQQLIIPPLSSKRSKYLYDFQMSIHEHQQQHCLQIDQQHTFKVQEFLKQGQEAISQIQPNLDNTIFQQISKTLSIKDSMQLQDFESINNASKTYNIRISNILPVSSSKKNQIDNKSKFNQKNQNTRGFALVGKNILSSYQTNNHLKVNKYKQNPTAKGGKTQQSSILNKSPSLQPYNKNSSMTHRNSNQKIQNDSVNVVNIHTQHNVPAKNSRLSNHNQELNSEIQIFNGENLFKKKKKIYSKGTNLASIDICVDSIDNCKIQSIKRISKKDSSLDGSSLSSYIQPLTNKHIYGNCQSNISQIQSIR